MPKLKTNRSAKKRLRVTKSGKIKHFKASKSHLLTGKSGKRKRQLAKAGYVSDSEVRTMHKLLPYGA